MQWSSLRVYDVFILPSKLSASSHSLNLHMRILFICVKVISIQILDTITWDHGIGIQTWNKQNEMETGMRYTLIKLALICNNIWMWEYETIYE